MQKITGGVGAWKFAYLQAQPGSTWCREKHGENRSVAFELLSSGNESLDLQMILKDEQLRLDAAAVVEDRLLSWVPS